MNIERAGSTLKLEFNGHGYIWTGKSVPDSMKGLWLSPSEAQTAAANYVDAIEKKADRKKDLINWERTPLEDLEMLSRKTDLLEFAEKNDVRVPEDKKGPSAIKSYIKKHLESLNG